MLTKMTIISYVVQLLECFQKFFSKVGLFTSPTIKARIHSEFLRRVCFSKFAN
jgi:hypothetical protein